MFIKRIVLCFYSEPKTVALSFLWYKHSFYRFFINLEQHCWDQFHGYGHYVCLIYPIEFIYSKAKNELPLV